jgi:hypothetical protein
MQTFKKLPTTAPKMNAKQFKNIELFPVYLLKFFTFDIIAGLLDDSEVARQFCHLIPLRRLRPVTLRPTFSGGLPFSSFAYILRQKITKVKRYYG